MYSITTSEVSSFLSTDFMPVSTDSTVSSAAVDGELSKVAVTTAGAGYNNGTYTSVNVYGDGSSGVVTVVVAGGAVSTVTVTTAGTGYTFANININSISGIGTPSTSAVASIFITPKGGHGYDAVTELGGFYVMMSTTITGAEGSGDFVIDNDFRRVGLIRDPYNYGTTTVSTSATLSAVKSVTFASSPTPGTFQVDEVITGGSATSPKGKVVAWDSSTRILKYIQTEWSGVDNNNDLKVFSASEILTGGTSSATGTVSTINNPEVAYNSGEIMYVENRAPITRASDQSEIIRLVVEF
jgi:hypothetical protein